LLIGLFTNSQAFQINIEDLDIEPPPQINPVLENDSTKMPTNEEISDMIEKGFLVPADEPLTSPAIKNEPDVPSPENSGIVQPIKLPAKPINNEIPVVKNKVPEYEVDSALSNAIANKVLNTSNYYAGSLLSEFYNCRDNESAWITNKKLNSNASDLVSILESAQQYGLHPKDYSLDKIRQYETQMQSNYSQDKAAELDLLLTDAYFKFITHVSEGRYDAETNNPTNKLSNIKETLVDQLDIALLLNDISGSSNEAQPNNIHYWNLQSALSNWLNINTIEFNSFSIPNMKKDSVLTYKAAANALLYYNYLDTATINIDSLVIDALKKFQTENGLLADGIIGKNTIAALEMSNAERYSLMAMNLEKMRMDEAIPSKHIWVNLPSYRLRYYINNYLADEHKVIIGTNRTKTPLISSELQHFILNPYWNVPWSIATGEMLPRLKRDPGYLKRNNFKVISGGSIVNSNNINWNQYSKSNFPFRFRQDGGVENALGIVKFRFPNNSSIYFHDTQNKSLFNKEIRAFSHGCVRVEGPINFAKFIVTEDQNIMNSDTIDYYVEKFERKQIDLNEPIPVFLKYYSVEGSEDGSHPIFYKDVYGRDKKLLKAIKKETERLIL